MQYRLPPVCRDLVDLQCGVISRQQAILGGMDPDVVARLVRSGRWQRLQRGSYAVFTGTPPREAQLWAALHGAGPGAVLSHQTAAELFRLIDSRSSLIHVTVPAPRHIDRAAGVVIHRSTRLDDARHPSLLPPRTRIEETVLDLVQQAAAFRRRLQLGLQRLPTTAYHGWPAAAAMELRKKARWRGELAGGAGGYRGGRAFAAGVPVRARRRAAARPAGGRPPGPGSRRGYLDNLYEEYQVCVELDGRTAHPDDRRWQDIHRDNAAAAEGQVTLRYSWADIAQRACPTGWEVGTTLSTQRGWPGPHPPRAPTALRGSLRPGLGALYAEKSPRSRSEVGVQAVHQAGGTDRAGEWADD